MARGGTVRIEPGRLPRGGPLPPQWLGGLANLRYACCMLIDEIKARITQAVKDKDEVARDILRLAFGEVQTAEARSNRALRDDEVTAIVRKLVKANEETLSLGGEGPQSTTLRHEIDLLSSLLPKTLTIPQIVEALESQREAIRAAKNDGQATGIAMKHLKTTGAVFDGNDVSSAVKTLRG